MTARKVRRTPKPIVKKYSAGQLYDLIEATHEPPEWACFPEVGQGTGGAAGRRADALAMSLWPSRGLVLRGFEIKVSKHDYRREAADPMKAEVIAKFCDEWWIVAPEGLIQDVDIELPPAWGLMVPGKKGGLRTVKKAETTKAEPLTRPFVAAVMRATNNKLVAGRTGWIRVEDIEDRVKAAEERGKAEVPRETQFLKRSNDGMRKVLEEWKEKTGIDLMGRSSWLRDIDGVVKAYKLGKALLGRYDDIGMLVSSWERMEKTAREMKGRLADILPELD